MPEITPEAQLVDELGGLTTSVVAETRIDDADVVAVLQFVGQLVVLVQQAFDQVLASMIALSYLKPGDLQEPRRTELMTSLDNLLARSRYKDVEEICSRLHGLSEAYETVLRPKLGSLADSGDWGRVWALLDEHEGQIIWMVSSRISDLKSWLSKATDSDLPSIRALAAAAKDDLEKTLQRLWSLRNQILGLSGEAGLLELLATGRRTEAISTAAHASTPP